MVKKKIMILGASQCQVPIITQAQEMGFEVVVVSVTGNYPGFSVADKAYEIDVRDRGKILEVAKEERICGILTDQTDLPVLTVAYVADQLGLPGVGYDCALRFTNKYNMRQYCERVGVPGPKHSKVSSLQEAVSLAKDFRFPLVLKPVDSQGSRGVIKIDVKDDLEDAFQKAIVHSAVQEVILEEFFQGREVVIEGFMANNQFTNLVIGDREYFDLPNMFIPRQTIFPSQIKSELQERLLELNTKLVKGFAPKFGITHSEFLVDERTSEVRLVETAIRGGGVFISSDLIPLASGINVNKRLISLASGEGDTTIDLGQVTQRAAAYMCFCLPEGQIHSVKGLQDVQAINGVRKAFLDDLQVGRLVPETTDKTMRQGPILIAGENRQDLQDIMDNVQDTLKIEVKTPTGIKNMIW